MWICQLVLVSISRGLNIFGEQRDVSSGTHCNNGQWPVYENGKFVDEQNLNLGTVHEEEEGGAAMDVSDDDD